MSSPVAPRTGGGPQPRQAVARARSRSELLRTALFLASVLVVIGVFVFSTLMVRRLSEQVSATSDLLAKLCAQASFPATLNKELERILSGVLAGIDFPIIITDPDSIPRAWRGVGLDPSLVPDGALDSLARGRPIDPVFQARVDRLRAYARTMDRKHRPIIMARTGAALGLLHYGDPPLLERLRWMPYLTASGIGLLLALGMWGYSGIRRAERRSIWVGMALETAHQLGTPLSSLMGWIELLRSRLGGADAPSQGSEVTIPREEMVETLDEMERDVERLTKVAQRFSRVGSAPKLDVQDVAAVVRQAVQYVRRRLPRHAGEVTIEERYVETPALPCNPELMEWAIENLLSNAVSALDKSPGRIEVWVGPRPEGRGAEIGIKDNGRGMTLGEQRRAFDPGYTTKPRGWGLGLALARRVVEDYHRGRIFIRHSAPEQGTTLIIRLPG